MRIIFFLYFHSPEYSFSNTIAAFILGLRFDLRTVCIITLPVLLFGSMRLHYNKIQRRLSASSIILIILMLIISFVAILFLRNNKAGILSISGVIVLLMILIIALLSSRNLNPFISNKSGRIWKSYLLIITSIIAFLYVLDFQHFDYLHQRLNASILNYTQDAKISFNMVWQTYPVIKIILMLVATIFILYFLINKTYRFCSHKKYFPSLTGSILSVVVVFLLIAGIFGTFSQYPLRWSDAFSFADDFKASLALNPVQSFFSSLQYRKVGYDQKKVEAYYPLMASYLGISKRDSASLNFTRKFSFENSSEARPNVIIVICESFSAYKSSMYGNPLNTTPYFNKLCNEGIFFDRCFTPAYGTARGVWAVITGIPDVESPNTASRNPAIVDQHSIINDMTGYEKYYFLGGSTSWANIRGLLTNNIQGLHLYEEGSYKAKAIDVWGISDKHLFLEASDVLKQEKKPFFAVIQTSDNHRPYTIPSEDKNEFKIVSYPSDTLKKYGFSSNEELNAFRYTDFCYSKFIEKAKKEAYFSNTIFVFVGDHGIRGDAGNMFPRLWTDFGVTTQHVPLLFYSPSLLKPERLSATCSQVDILPTVASLIHMPYLNQATGKNILDIIHNDPSIMFPNHAFLYDPDVNQIGMMTDKFCYIKNLNNNKEDVASSVNNEPIMKDRLTDSTINELKKLTEAWYETSKYMLSHNKKTANK